MSENPFQVAANKAQHLSQTPSNILLMYNKLYRTVVRQQMPCKKVVQVAKDMFNDPANLCVQTKMSYADYDGMQLLITKGVESLSVRGGYSSTLPDYSDLIYQVDERCVLWLDTGLFFGLSNAPTNTWVKPLFTRLAILNTDLLLTYADIIGSAKKSLQTLNEKDLAEVSIEDCGSDLGITLGAESLWVTNNSHIGDGEWNGVCYYYDTKEVSRSTALRPT